MTKCHLVRGIAVACSLTLGMPAKGYSQVASANVWENYEEIASTLEQHADLRILIEGHTDNVGSAASNLALSEARVAAVKGALVAEFGVDGNRITTKGFGDMKPSVPDTTPRVGRRTGASRS